ncbi:ABC transporter ATP-binding protein [Micromonospora eburnea]|uniref:Putative ABC transport system ATP-binding protein n=1 Tax=Micromonospora eburnea TaxID=227316 RepID=A0A1C6UJ46_9ACTN|nr:ABC transporter ATP-binding protein [Micromonospora eburnea]SCL54080.1 putative ABC transport system ATP-binding protein [Micromonospora eburnea]
MLIEARGVKVRIGSRTVFDNVAVTCESGQMTALIGPSGCGKTTLLHCLGLLQQPTRGQVRIDGVETTGWRDSARRKFWRHHAAFVQQDYGVIDDETVGFNATMQMSILGRRLPADQRRLDMALERTGLPGRSAELAAHLSGGEKQRLAIARAIYKSADVLFADEPTASLDPDNREHVTALLRQLADSGTTVIIATHDERLATACDKTHDLASPPNGTGTASAG